MTTGSDLCPDEAKFSPTAKALLRLQSRVEEKWMAAARATIKSAACLDRPILIDTLPLFLKNLAEALSPEHDRALASADSSVAEEHGSERARVTSYDLGQLIAEYQLLKKIIFTELKNEVTLSDSDATIIDDSVNLAIRESATAFTLVQSSIREQFVATLSHDVKNPLNAIKLAAEMLPEEFADPEEALVLCQLILRNVQRAERLIHDLLDTTLIKTGGRLKIQIEQCDLCLVAQECLNFHRASGVNIEFEGTSVMGWWSQYDLTRALENLIGNAVKYGSDKSPVVVKVVEHKGRALVSVHNEGTAIPLDQQGYIFQAFRRAEKAQQGQSKGWGLGLALVRGIAEAHGGSIVVDSSPERGTTFTIDIPIDARPFNVES